MADTTISQLNTINALSATNYIPISDGTDTTKLGTDSLFGFRNRIINGDMRIWQRGTSFTGVGTGTYTADRFQLTLNGVNGTVTQSTDVPNLQSFYSLKFVPASNATPIEFGVRQWMERQNIMDFAGNTVTASAWVKCTRTSIKVRCTAYTTGGTDQIQTITVVANTWTKITATFSSFSAVTSWTGAPNGPGGFLDIKIAEPVALTTADSLFITGVQLEVGSTATPFERRPIGTELALCQRYYETLTNDTEGICIASYFHLTNINRSRWFFKVTKRAQPIVGLVSGTAWASSLVPTIYPSLDNVGFYKTSTNFGTSGPTGVPGFYADAEL
jgi:hypothetical protein